MAFGKVTVRSESGALDEYELTRPTTSVGRQPGNDIVLNTSAVSRYHAQFDADGGQVFLVDLGTVNGTFVNDVQVVANGRVPLSDGDVIVMGDMQLVFSEPTAPVRAAISLTPVATAVEDPGIPFRLLVDEPQQSVAPGARLQIAMVIENLTEREQTYQVDIGGMAAEWASLSRREALLIPHEQAEVMVSIKPPRSSDTNPGRYPLTLKVALREDPLIALEALREIDVVGYSGLGMTVGSGHQHGSYHVAVQNQGNVPIDVQMGGFNRERLLVYQFDPPRLHVKPNQTQYVNLKVSPRRMPFGGSSRTVSFAVVARSLDAAGYQAPVPAHYTITGSWLPWLAGAMVPLGIGALLVAALLVAALLFLGVIPSPLASLAPTPGAAVGTEQAASA